MVWRPVPEQRRANGSHQQLVIAQNASGASGRREARSGTTEEAAVSGSPTIGVVVISERSRVVEGLLTVRVFLRDTTDEAYRQAHTSSPSGSHRRCPPWSTAR